MLGVVHAVFVHFCQYQSKHYSTVDGGNGETEELLCGVIKIVLSPCSNCMFLRISITCV